MQARVYPHWVKTLPRATQLSVAVEYVGLLSGAKQNRFV